MKKHVAINSVAVLLLAASWSQVASAQVGCGDLVFTGDIARQYPNAKNACLDVVTKDGQQFAHFKARITRVRGNTVEAEFKQPDGTYTRPISFTPAPNARIRIAGQSYRYSDLTRGQELDVYLPPNRWAVAVPETEEPFLTARVVTIVALEEPSPAFAALPRTASPLTAIGLLGGMLALLAGLARVVRSRWVA
jgi:hypothetical protein